MRELHRLPKVAKAKARIVGIKVRRVRRFRSYVERAAVTFVIQMIYRGLRQYRLLAFLKAVGTKPVNWLAACVLRLQDVHENTASHFLKLVTRFLGVPLFVLHDFLFKLSFGFGQCLILGLCGKQLGLSLKQTVLDVSDSLLGFNVLDSLQDGRDAFHGNTQRRPSSGDIFNHADGLSGLGSNCHRQSEATPINLPNS